MSTTMPGAASKTLPPPPATSFSQRPAATRRRPALIGLAVLLIVGAAAVAGLLAVRVDTRTPVLVASRAISVGQPITTEDLAVQRVAGDGLNVIAAGSASSLVGNYASENIPAGRLLDTSMFASQGFLKEGTVAVGVALTAGRMPASGIQTGDIVQVVAVKDGVATVVVERATVSRGPGSDASSGGGFLGGAPSGSAGSAGVATLIVSPTEAPKVAAVSVANEIAIILVSRGGG